MAEIPTLILSPAWGATEATDIPFNEAELGDGYRSRVNQTISITKTWDIRRAGLTTTEKDELLNELSVYAGVDAFLWSPHPDLPKSVFSCEEWNETPIGPDNWELSTRFIEDQIGEHLEFAEFIDITSAETMLAGSRIWLTTYTRDTPPLAANSNYITVNAFHNVLGRGGYFPGSAGTTEGQAALGRACMEAFFVTNDVTWKNYAIAIGEALIQYYYNDPVPGIGDEFDTLWAPHWLINVKESFVSRGPQVGDPLNYGDFGREITFTNGVGTISSGNPANGELLAVVYKVYSTDGVLLWNNVDTPLISGVEYAVEYFVSNFQLKGQNYKIFADTESSGGTPPVATPEAAGTIKLTGTYSGTAKLVYSTYTGPTIAVGELFEPYSMWRPLLPTEAQAAFDVFPWSYQFYSYLYQETSDDKWRRAAEATTYSAILTAQVENLSFYYQKSDSTELFTYPGSQAIIVDNINGYTENRQVGGDKDQWLRLDVNAAPPLQVNPDGSLVLDANGDPVGPFPSIEVQNFAITTGVDSSTTIYAEAAHSQGGIVEIGLSTDTDPFTFDQIYKQYWQLNASGAATSRTFNPREFIRWDGDYLTWFADIAEDPIYTYEGFGGSATTSIIFDTFTYNGVTAPGLVGVLTLNENGGFAGGGLVFDNLGARITSPPRLFLRHSGDPVRFKVIDGSGNDFFYDIADTAGDYTDIQPTWAQMTGDEDPNVSDAITSIEFVATGVSTTYIWFASPGALPEQLDIPIFTYKAVLTSRQRSAHSIWVGDFKPVGNTLDTLLYNPGVVPFTVNLLNGEISDWRGIPYAGYQSPYMWQQWGLLTRQVQVEEFLLAAQAAYANQVPGGKFGPFAPVFSWSYWDNGDFLANGLNGFGWNGPDPNTAWAPYALRAVESAAHTWYGDKLNGRLKQITMQFLRYLDDDYLARGNYSPITDFPPDTQGQANYEEPHAAALIGRTALYANLSGGDPVVTFRVLKTCFEYVESQYIATGTMTGSFANGQPDYSEGGTVYKEYFIFWHAEIIEFLALVIKFKPDLTYPGVATLLPGPA